MLGSRPQQERFSAVICILKREGELANVRAHRKERLIRHSRENGNPSSSSTRVSTLAVTRHFSYANSGLRLSPESFSAVICIVNREGELANMRAHRKERFVRHSRENGNPSFLRLPLDSGFRRSNGVAHVVTRTALALLILAPIPVELPRAPALPARPLRATTAPASPPCRRQPPYRTGW